MEKAARWMATNPRESTQLQNGRLSPKVSSRSEPQQLWDSDELRLEQLSQSSEHSLEQSDDSDEQSEFELQRFGARPSSHASHTFAHGNPDPPNLFPDELDEHCLTARMAGTSSTTYIQ
jgi:hypothetical protein